MSKELHPIPIDGSVIYAEFTISRAFDGSTLTYPDKERFVVSYKQEKAYTSVEVVPKFITFTVPWGFKAIKGKRKVWQVNGEAVVTSHLPKKLKDFVPSENLVVKQTAVGQGTYLYTYDEKGRGAGEHIRTLLVQRIKTCFAFDDVNDIDSLMNKIKNDKGVNDLLGEFSEKNIEVKISVNLVQEMKEPQGDEFCIKDVADKYISSVVSIRADDSKGGTGFVIAKGKVEDKPKRDVHGNEIIEKGEDGKDVTEKYVTLTLLTCEHVLRSSENPRARFSNGIVEYEIKNVNFLTSYDLALCEICVPEAIANAADIIQIEGNKPENGDGIVLIGNNLGASIVKLFGNVGEPMHKDKYGETFLQTDVNSNPGCSGGPILDNNGVCIGILCKRESSDGKGTLYYGIALATPTYIDDVKKKINEALNKGGNS